MEKIILNYKLLIFDFDYTLFDTSEGVIFCMKKALQGTGFTEYSNKRIKEGIGLTLHEFFSQYCEDEKIIKDMERIFLESSKEMMVEKTYPLKNTLSVINELHQRGYLLGIYTGKYFDRVSRTLNKYSIFDKFNPIICGDRIINKKPDPEGLILCMSHHPNFDISEVSYIGDHYYDIIAAQRAGIDAIAVASGETERSKLLEYRPKYVINDLIELIE